MKYFILIYKLQVAITNFLLPPIQKIYLPKKFLETLSLLCQAEFPEKVGVVSEIG